MGKNYKGGYQIIDLSSVGVISVEDGGISILDKKDIYDSVISIIQTRLNGGTSKLCIVKGIQYDDMISGITIGRVVDASSLMEGYIEFSIYGLHVTIYFLGSFNIETGELELSDLDLNPYLGIDDIDDVNYAITQSLESGILKEAIQSKTLSVSDFPLTNDFDTQHAVVNQGLLPDDDMSGLSTNDINKLRFTLSRIINKGWLCDGDSKAIKIVGIEFTDTRIQITATSVFYANGTEDAILSYLITLDGTSYTIKSYEL